MKSARLSLRDFGDIPTSSEPARGDENGGARTGSLARTETAKPARKGRGIYGAAHAMRPTLKRGKIRKKSKQGRANETKAPGRPGGPGARRPAVASPVRRGPGPKY